MTMKRFLKKNLMAILIIVTGAILIYMTTIRRADDPAIAIAAEQQKQLNQTVDLLIGELYEEKHMRKICEEAVDRWTTSARTRQEVKNEARRLREKNKKKEKDIIQ